MWESCFFGLSLHDNTLSQLSFSPSSALPLSCIWGFPSFVRVMLMGYLWLYTKLAARIQR